MEIESLKSHWAFFSVPKSKNINYSPTCSVFGKKKNGKGKAVRYKISLVPKVYMKGLLDCFYVPLVDFATIRAWVSVVMSTKATNLANFMFIRLFNWKIDAYIYISPSTGMGAFNSTN